MLDSRRNEPPTQSTSLGSLSEDARKMRMPQKPEDLVGALNDPIHRDIGRSRPVRKVRVTTHRIRH